MASNEVHWREVDAYVEAYLEDCDDRDLSPKTISWYGWHLRRAIKWLEASPGYNASALLSDEGMRAYYRSTKALAVTTRRHMVAALHAFGTWLESNHGIVNPAAKLKKPRKPKTLPTVVNPTELERLLDALETEPAREKALVLFLLDTGLRVSEVANLRRAHLDLRAGQLTVCKGKGNKDRVVFFFDRAREALKAYLDTHSHESVFVSQSVGPPPNFKPLAPEPLTDSGIRQILRRIGERHEIANLRPHTLRHTCGTELAANGVDLCTIGDQLGHEDIATVKIYTQLADVRRREVLRHASPVDRIAARAGVVPNPDWPANGRH